MRTRWAGSAVLCVAAGRQNCGASLQRGAERADATGVGVPVIVPCPQAHAIACAIGRARAHTTLAIDAISPRAFAHECSCPVRSDREAEERTSPPKLRSLWVSQAHGACSRAARAQATPALGIAPGTPCLARMAPAGRRLQWRATAPIESRLHGCHATLGTKHLFVMPRW